MLFMVSFFLVPASTKAFWFGVSNGPCQVPLQFGMGISLWRRQGCLRGLGSGDYYIGGVGVGGRNKTLALEDLLSSSRKRTSGLCSSVGQRRKGDGNYETNTMIRSKTTFGRESSACSLPSNRVWAGREGHYLGPS